MSQDGQDVSTQQWVADLETLLAKMQVAEVAAALGCSKRAVRRWQLTARYGRAGHPDATEPLPVFRAPLAKLAAGTLDVPENGADLTVDPAVPSWRDRWL